MLLRIELLGDGGIRLYPPDGVGGLGSVRMVDEWVGDARRRGYAVRLTGEVDAAVHNGLVERLRSTAADVDLTVEPSTPESWARRWTSLQVAADNGLTEQVVDLVARGTTATSRRRDHSPVRLAMRHGHIDTLAALKEAGWRFPRGSQPPAALPDAVVLRNFLAPVVHWISAAYAVVGVTLAVALQQSAFLAVAAVVPLAVAVANFVVGRTRLAADGPRLAVRQIRSWQGPIDLSELVAVGFSPVVVRRHPERWRFVQQTAGPPLRRSAAIGFERKLAAELAAHDDLRVVTVYCGRGYLVPGFSRHVNRHVGGTGAVLSATAQAVLERFGPPQANRR